MSVVDVGVVDVAVPQGLVPVRVGMGVADRPVVLMAMVVVVAVAVLVLEGFVGVFVSVPFGEVQPQTDPHQHAG